MYLETLGVLVAFFTIVFIIGQILHDNSIVDIGWGAGFVVSALYTFWRNPEAGLKASIITLAVTIWGLRLAIHIAKRNIGKPEDYRYVNMRKRWGDKYVLVKAFVNVYLLQCIIQFIVTLPVIYGNTTMQQELYWFNIVGIGIWGIGFFFEAYGDYQLKVFKNNPENKGRLMTTGLWALTRHPNYFGDAAMWFGIFFIAISSQNGLWILVGPALMTFFLRYVSGVRLLEKKYANRPDYAAYKKRTNSFLPWFPKKS